MYALLLAATLFTGPHTIEAAAVLRDYSHPKHAGDFHEEKLTATLAADRGALALRFGDERFVLRGNELFDAEMKPVERAGDLRPLTLARLDPLYVQSLVETHRASAKRSGSTLTVARGNELWQIRLDDKGRPRSIETAVVHDLYGDLVETVTYENWQERGGIDFPSRITVAEGKRVKAILDVTGLRQGADDEMLRKARDPRAIHPEDVTFREIAPGLFAADLKPSNSRVFVAEFDDFLFVIEGAYNDRNVSSIVARVRERWPSKRVRFFSFSHIHGQYIGGMRSWVDAGAEVITTRSGAGVAREIADSTHGASGPMKAKIDVVEARAAWKDDTNELVAFNIDSQHTDDYLVFYFPRTKTLLAGDLLCHRGPDKPLRGRSKHLCETLPKLGVDVEQIHITWPLDGYGCISPVRFDDFVKSCAVPAQ